MRVGIVGCSRTKRQGTHPARELYTGALFRKALDLSLHLHDRTVIVSALHGVIHPDHVLEAYDYSMSDMSPAERVQWGMSVAWALPHADTYVAYCGSAYLAAFAPFVSTPLIRPMQGMGIGQQLHHLSEELEACA